MFPIFVFQYSFLLNVWESKMRSNRSVVTSQVNHVFCFSVSAVSSVSPVKFHTVQLFLFPTRGSEGVMFFLVFFVECCIESHHVLNH